jgi:hypothetical protein
MNELVLDAIFSHANTDVRLKVVHLLAFTGHPSAYSQLRELAVKEGMREDVKTALLEAIYKLEKSKPAEEKSDESLPLETVPELEMLEAETVAGHFELQREESDVAEFQPQLDELRL